MSCLVHEGLSSFQECREPAIAYARISQTLRSADAVYAIERFLTPFGCRSMLEYGYCEGDMAETLRMPRLSDAVDDTPKAHALLRLLDLTIGHTRDTMIPEDLAIALDRIESEARGLTSDPAFRRLAAAARR